MARKVERVACQQALLAASTVVRERGGPASADAAQIGTPGWTRGQVALVG
ncbi:MAG: hypothetical protein WBP61_19780 [Nocardioides sp.]